MPDKNDTEQLSEELIREALARDIESIEPPPPEKIWLRIETELHGGRSSRQVRGGSWPRYAAIAAALLIIALSSVGILQMTDIAAPMLDEAPAEEAPMRAADEEMDALLVEEVETPEEAEEEAEEVEIFSGEEVVSALPPFETTVDPSPPEWQEIINDNFYFDEAVLLSAGDGPDYHGAIYQNDEDTLLWVKSKNEWEETTSFINYLGEHIQTEPQQVEEVDGYIHFETAGQPGLAWQEGDQNQALIVMSGHVSIEQLERITDEVD